MRPTDPKITRRSRRRNRGKGKFVWWAGRWLEREIHTERIVLADGSILESYNETWNDPAVLEAYHRSINPL